MHPAGECRATRENPHFLCPRRVRCARASVPIFPVPEREGQTVRSELFAAALESLRLSPSPRQPWVDATPNPISATSPVVLDRTPVEAAVKRVGVGPRRVHRDPD